PARARERPPPPGDLVGAVGGLRRDRRPERAGARRRAAAGQAPLREADHRPRLARAVRPAPPGPPRAGRARDRRPARPRLRTVVTLFPRRGSSPRCRVNDGAADIHPGARRMFGFKDVFTALNALAGVVALALCAEGNWRWASTAVMAGYVADL